MMEYNLYETFRGHISTLKECSKDHSDPGCIKFMTESQLEAINFDTVKTKYANDLVLSEECAASVDALLETDENIAFVEFKNGKVNNRNIKDKIRDSLLLFCDLTKQTISDTRKNLDFIVVYNEEKKENWVKRVIGLVEQHREKRVFSFDVCISERKSGILPGCVKQYFSSDSSANGNCIGMRWTLDGGVRRGDIGI